MARLSGKFRMSLLWKIVLSVIGMLLSVGANCANETEGVWTVAREFYEPWLEAAKLAALGQSPPGTTTGDTTHALYRHVADLASRGAYDRKLFEKAIHAATNPDTSQSLGWARMLTQGKRILRSPEELLAAAVLWSRGTSQEKVSVTQTVLGLKERRCFGWFLRLVENRLRPPAPPTEKHAFALSSLTANAEPQNVKRLLDILALVRQGRRESAAALAEGADAEMLPAVQKAARRLSIEPVSGLITSDAEEDLSLVTAICVCLEARLESKCMAALMNSNHVGARASAIEIYASLSGQLGSINDHLLAVYKEVKDSKTTHPMMVQAVADALVSQGIGAFAPRFQTGRELWDPLKEHVLSPHPFEDYYDWIVYEWVRRENELPWLRSDNRDTLTTSAMYRRLQEESCLIRHALELEKEKD